MRFSMMQGGLVRLGVSALALSLLAGAALAEDDVVVDEDPGVLVLDEDGVIIDDPMCIACSGIPDDEDVVTLGDEGEEPTGEEPTGEEPGWEAWSEGGEEPVEYLEDGEPVIVADDGVVGPEAWQRGDDILSIDDGVAMSPAYLNALCTDPAFRGVSACAGFVAD